MTQPILHRTDASYRADVSEQPRSLPIREGILVALVSVEVIMRKRELINTRSDKRYVRRDMRGRFSESDDMGRSLAQDRPRKAKTKVKKGQGDRGDR